MQKVITLSILLTAFTVTTWGCKEKDPLAAKKKELAELKSKQASLVDDITKLEAEVAKLDPNAVPEKPKLVSLDTIKTTPFSHFIELQGKVDAENIAYVSPRNGTGGQVKGVYVKKGERVHKGQLLLKLDDAIARKQIAQQETQLAYAQNLYERRNNLWKENIGTEVELITAKNNVDQAQRQLDLAKEQLSFSNVYADMDGVAEEVNIRVGELFTGQPTSGIKLVNTSNLKVTAQVPENYQGKVKEGDKLEVVFPDINKSITARISLSGQLIDANSRSFYIEAHLPDSKEFKPNQVALVKIQDYTTAAATTAPINTLQTDEKGKFLLVAINEKGKLRAKKRVVQAGELYGDRIEIKTGLQAGDVIITDGYQSLYDGQLITTH
ncbi:RND family efflux transporter, MFP subunit [Filimonas lacunae]|uniref:RND family efflux transporter, MFP subunit n=1 Tax=Filimonas lacunae TaxID=477680 RepID=A0A173MQT4_9BACT|nr:efflux RND transporter periplasmic adaptor subunit [Filimonas lacunae]BAV10014.1 Co/Zn/Cd efflux system membrane fusion protein [Filimonas lacunae]SIS82559.1 RND family efflux transporter, MFP subunit [Filimonas lacunae]